MKQSHFHVRVPRKLMNDINVVPYIDVMLVLLVIFMVTAPVMTQGLDVNLPNAESSAVPSEQEPVTVTVLSDGSYYMDIGEHPKQSTSLKAITHQASLIKEQRPDTLFMVQGDEHVDYGKVIRLMAALQAAGITKLALITEPAGQ